MTEVRVAAITAVETSRDPTSAAVAATQPALLVAVDVLHHHHRVVHQHADADDETEQGQRVHGLAHGPDRAAGDDQGERNARHRHQGHGDAAQEDEEHGARQESAEDPGEREVSEGLADLLALVEPDQEVDPLELGVVVHGLDPAPDLVADHDRVAAGLGDHR